jgi:hypothetical protein
MKITILTILIFCTLSGHISAKVDPVKSTTKIDSLHLLVSLNEIERIEKLIPKKEPNWFNSYGTMVVAIVALIGTVVTSAITNRRSRLNTQAQLEASAENITRQLNSSHENLMKQIKASQAQEIEKKKLDLAYKLKSELKENIAKFINKAQTLNRKLTVVIYDVYENSGEDAAMQVYGQTNLLRQELLDIFYSIKVTLDGSTKQMELEEILNEYMNTTCIHFDLTGVRAEGYEQPIGHLYHKIKSIIHENYVVPI